MEISEIRTAAPAEGRAAVELETFALLDRLHIPYAWVAHETADTIADCDVVSEVLGISAAGRYIAVLYSDRLTIYDKNWNEHATLEGVSTARQVLMRADGSAVLAGSASASLYLP